MAADDTTELCIAISRFKLSKEVWKSTKSRKVVVFAEAFYDDEGGETVRSGDTKLSYGAQIFVPYVLRSTRLKEVVLHFYLIDGLLTVDFGESSYLVQAELASADMNIYQNGSTRRIGKVICSFRLQDPFEGSAAKGGQGDEPSKGPPLVVDYSQKSALPNFRFKKLSRNINWERIKAFNIDKVLQNNDTNSVVACINDVATGDVTQEDIDPKLYKALQLSQYGAQYIMASRDFMKKKEGVVKSAIKTFEDEERLLDRKIAKLKARKKGLTRESKDLDNLANDYTSILHSLRPSMVDDLYTSYRRKLKGKDRKDGGGQSTNKRRESDSSRNKREEHKRQAQTVESDRSPSPETIPMEEEALSVMDPRRILPLKQPHTIDRVDSDGLPTDGSWTGRRENEHDRWGQDTSPSSLSRRSSPDPQTPVITPVIRSTSSQWLDAKVPSKEAPPVPSTVLQQEDGGRKGREEEVEEREREVEVEVEESGIEEDWKLTSTDDMTFIDLEDEAAVPAPVPEGVGDEASKHNQAPTNPTNERSDAVNVATCSSDAVQSRLKPLEVFSSGDEGLSDEVRTTGDSAWVNRGTKSGKKKQNTYLPLSLSTYLTYLTIPYHTITQ